jgi:hypothetical protein
MDTTNNNNTNEEIQTKLGIVADALKATQDMLIKYATGVTDLLSGQQTAAKPKRVAVTPGKKLGRPVGSKNKPKSIAPNGAAAMQMTGETSQDVVIPPAPRVPVIAAPLAIPDAPPATKELHPKSVEMFHLIKKQGKIKMVDLADKVGIHRNLAHYHVDPLVERGKVVVVRHKINGRRTDVIYTPREAAKYFASM